jgi:hypothetical protein
MLDRSDLEEIRIACGFLDTHVAHIGRNDDSRCIAYRTALTSCDSTTTATAKFFARTSPRGLTKRWETVDLVTDSESPPSLAC